MLLYQVVKLIHDGDLIEIRKMNATQCSEVLKFRIGMIVQMTNDLDDLVFLNVMVRKS